MIILIAKVIIVVVIDDHDKNYDCDDHYYHHDHCYHQQHLDYHESLSRLSSWIIIMNRHSPPLLTAPWVRCECCTAPEIIILEVICILWYLYFGLYLYLYFVLHFRFQWYLYEDCGDEVGRHCQFSSLQRWHQMSKVNAGSITASITGHPRKEKDTSCVMSGWSEVNIFYLIVQSNFLHFYFHLLPLPAMSTYKY